MNKKIIMATIMAPLLLTMSIAPNAYALYDIIGPIDLEGIDQRLQKWFETSKKELKDIKPKVEIDKKIKNLEKQVAKLDSKTEKACDKAEKYKEKFEETQKATDLSKALKHGKQCVTSMYKLDTAIGALETQIELKAKYFD